jgi:hypothetical protein
VFHVVLRTSKCQHMQRPLLWHLKNSLLENGRNGLSHENNVQNEYQPGPHEAISASTPNYWREVHWGKLSHAWKAGLPGWTQSSVAALLMARPTLSKVNQERERPSVLTKLLSTRPV